MKADTNQSQWFNKMKHLSPECGIRGPNSSSPSCTDFAFNMLTNSDRTAFNRIL